MKKTSAILSSLRALPQRGSVVESVRLNSEAMMVRFDDGTGISMPITDFEGIRDDEHLENAISWCETLFNTKRAHGVGGVFRREELEILVEKVVEDPLIADADNLRELIFRATMPDEAFTVGETKTTYNSPGSQPLLQELHSQSFSDKISSVARKVASRYMDLLNSHK